jgi:FtsH-binding integral membrane protein
MLHGRPTDREDEQEKSGMRRFADTMTWADDRGFAIHAAVDERMGFLRRTYLHLVLEIGAAAGITVLTVNTPALQKLAFSLLSNFIVYLLVIFGLSMLTRKLLQGSKPLSVQYAGAVLWVFFLGLLVSPLALIAKDAFGSYAILGEGFILTACIFVGLTAYVFFSKKDFSFLGGALAIGSWLLIGVGLIFWLFGGFSGSPLWSILWVVLLSGWVLYDTSQIMHRRHTSEHVAASVDLLVDFVFLFIHIVSLLMASRD